VENELVRINRGIADFMSASVPIEQHLQQGGRLTSVQLESIVQTVNGLQTFLDSWKRKHQVSDDLPQK
jgi:hypothetical protein